VNVRDDSSASDGSLDEGVELLVTSDCKLQMSGRDSLDLQVLGGVTCKLEDLSCEVFEDGSTVHCRSGSDSRVGAHSALQESVDSSYWELESSSC
jgi:hypothetical protein